MSVQPIEARRNGARGGDGRIPPYDLAAEEALLGAMMLSRDAIGVALENHCTAEDFYKPAHGHIYDAITTLYSAGEPADPITLADQLRRAGLLDAIGGPAELVVIEGGTPSTSNAAHYASIVEELSRLRRLIGQCAEITELAYSVPDDVDAVVDQAEARIFSIADRQTAGSVLPVSVVIPRFLDLLEARAESDVDIIGVASGFYDLDEILLGLKPGQLVVVGARPGMGKTAFALNIATNAVLAGVRTLFCSLEMSVEELLLRVYAAEGRIDATRLMKGKLYDSEIKKVPEVTALLDRAPLSFLDEKTLTIGSLRARARREAAKHGGIGLIVVDYLQLMDGGRRSNVDNREAVVAEIARGLKVLARELECPVLACSQLSRNLEVRSDKRPRLEDLRESGEIEQSADVVLFLYRDDYYNRESVNWGMAEVIVGKHRNGPLGMAPLAFLDHYTRFSNMART